MVELDKDAQLEEISPLLVALLEVSSELVEKYGNFLPHGASMNTFGQVSLAGAAPEQEMTNSEEVLPLLHEGLRMQTKEFSTRAVAVSESVFIGQNQTPAIKVLVEHREGATIAVYQTWKKRFLRSPQFGTLKMTPAEPEVGQWQQIFA